MTVLDEFGQDCSRAGAPKHAYQSGSALLGKHWVGWAC